MRKLFHELTHAAHYNKLTNVWYSQFVAAELSEITATLGSSNSPYGDGNMSNQSEPIIALGESWAYYMGHYMADKKYGTNASCQKEQVGGGTFCNTTNTFHPHIDVLEYFDPNLSADPFKWIPQGLYQDLRDVTNEQKLSGGYVNDNVSGYYTNQRFFNAFNSSITTLQGYKTNLLNQNANNQSTQVNGLFSDYHY